MAGSEGLDDRWFERRFKSWLDRRIKTRHELLLKQNVIYIVPSRTGLVFLFMVLLILLMGINFQNNLVYMVCFWLGALLVINILHTYRNLAGLIIRGVRGEPCFAGERALFELELENQSARTRYSIELGWPGQDWIQLDVPAGGTVRVRLNVDTEYRGWLNAPRLKLLTRYPTGLARAWAYAQLDTRALVYPKPELGLQLNNAHNQGNEQDDGAVVRGGSTDFEGVRDYQLGDSIRQIHWPAFARTRELASKTFVDYQSDDLWLDWNHLTMQGTEARLSHLTARVLELFEQRQPWGLRLPGVELSPEISVAHRDRCLAELALWQQG
jgi:uncharacterized protein (DUF58 family)